MAEQPDGPKLTLPDHESAALREAYANAGVILEYGMGGSTVVAAVDLALVPLQFRSIHNAREGIEPLFAANSCLNALSSCISCVKMATMASSLARISSRIMTGIFPVTS